VTLGAQKVQKAKEGMNKTTSKPPKCLELVQQKIVVWLSI